VCLSLHNIWPNVPAQCVSTPASYSRYPRFKSRPRDRLSWLRFSHNSSRQMPGQHLKFGHHRFLPNPFQFIIY
jgi:hypothetical protein